MKRIRTILMIALILALVAGCSPRLGQRVEPFDGPAPKDYIRQIVAQTIPKFAESGMSEYQKTKAAFDFLIETGYYQWPVALDVWRIRCGEGETLSFEENRSLGILLNGVGTCEDYSAALVMLLDGMGIEAKYMPGLTYHREGHLVHHAWVIAKVDGIWYHLDPQLEDGISKGMVKYKYFMRSDATMLASHRWGQNLIALGILEDEQNEEIAAGYLGETCPQDYPTPEPKQIPVTAEPDDDAIWAEFQKEYRDFVKAYGKPGYIEVDVHPPVFGMYGGYDGKGNIQKEREKDYLYQILVQRMLIQPG